MQKSSHVGVRRQIEPGGHAACRYSCEAAVIGGELNSNTTLRGMRNTDTWPMEKAPLSAHNHDAAVIKIRSHGSLRHFACGQQEKTWSSRPDSRDTYPDL